MSQFWPAGWPFPPAAPWAGTLGIVKTIPPRSGIVGGSTGKIVVYHHDLPNRGKWDVADWIRELRPNISQIEFVRLMNDYDAWVSGFHLDDHTGNVFTIRWRPLGFEMFSEIDSRDFSGSSAGGSGDKPTSDWGKTITGNGSDGGDVKLLQDLLEFEDPDLTVIPGEDEEEPSGSGGDGDSYSLNKEGESSGGKNLSGAKGGDIRPGADLPWFDYNIVAGMEALSEVMHQLVRPAGSRNRWYNRSQ
jgi:hypothetical protein